MAATNEDIQSNPCQCSICFGDYHRDTRVPRLLSCGHTFCEHCLDQLHKIANLQAISCPLCSGKTAIDSSASASLPKNYALLGCLEVTNSQTVASTNQCELCSKRAAQFGCMECEAQLCDDCWPDCHKVGKFRNHQKVSTDFRFASKCAHHPSETVRLVCVEPNCQGFNELICSLCEKTPAHKGHRTELIEQVATKRRTQLRENLGDAQNCVDYAQRIRARVQLARQNLSRDGQTKLDGVGENNAVKRKLISTRRWIDLLQQSNPVAPL